MPLKSLGKTKEIHVFFCEQFLEILQKFLSQFKLLFGSYAQMAAGKVHMRKFSPLSPLDQFGCQVREIA